MKNQGKCENFLPLGRSLMSEMTCFDTIAPPKNRGLWFF